jgi:hypothetical protein
MNTIAIPRILLNHPNKYLSKDGQYDILGCILLNRGCFIPDKTKLPSELKLELPPFTKKVRNKIVDTDLTISIISLDLLPKQQALVRANLLLFPQNIQIKLEDL